MIFCPGPRVSTTVAGVLIEHRVGIIVALYLVAARAAKAATQTVPVVFITGSDPIVAGLVPSLSRPTSNLTGVAFMFTRLGEKNLATLHELVPKAVVIGALVNPNNPNAEPQTRDLQAAARTLGLQLVTFAAGSDRDIDDIFSTASSRRSHVGVAMLSAGSHGQQRPLGTHRAAPSVGLVPRQGKACHPISRCRDRSWNSVGAR